MVKCSNDGNRVILGNESAVIVVEDFPAIVDACHVDELTVKVGVGDVGNEIFICLNAEVRRIVTRSHCCRQLTGRTELDLVKVEGVRTRQGDHEC